VGNMKSKKKVFEKTKKSPKTKTLTKAEKQFHDAMDELDGWIRKQKQE
jgi:recombination DNA repair RAD52 pathway protein